MQSVEDYTSSVEYLTGNKIILRSRDSDDRTFIAVRLLSAGGIVVGASVNVL
jgi:hypothetical protein